jgi:AcrR family transcriptional regulator
VAARVGVSEPVIFQHFGSKAALYAAVLDRVAGQIRAELQALVEHHGSACDLLAHALDPSHGTRLHGPGSHGVLFADAATLVAEPELMRPRGELSARSPFTLPTWYDAARPTVTSRLALIPRQQRGSCCRSFACGRCVPRSCRIHTDASAASPPSLWGARLAQARTAAPRAPRSQSVASLTACLGPLPQVATHRRGEVIGCPHRPSSPDGPVSSPGRGATHGAGLP